MLTLPALPACQIGGGSSAPNQSANTSGTLDRGFSNEFGARPMRREIQTSLEGPLSVKILEGRFSEGDRIRIDVRGRSFVFRKMTAAARKNPPRPRKSSTSKRTTKSDSKS